MCKGNFHVIEIEHDLVINCIVLIMFSAWYSGLITVVWIQWNKNLNQVWVIKVAVPNLKLLKEVYQSWYA